MSSRLATLVSVLAAVAVFATLHFSSSDVAYATTAEAATVRAGDCYSTQGCAPHAQYYCVNHCKDAGCEKDAVIPFELLVKAPFGGYKQVSEPCTDEYNCTYQTTDSTQMYTD